VVDVEQVNHQAIPDKPNSCAKRCGRVLLFAFLGVVVVVGGFALVLVARHNFHVVSEGRVYRSAQMDAGSLARTIQERGIKTVINLRGGNEASGWYRAEIETTRQLGAQHFDFNLSASREVSNAEMEEIIATMKNAPKPILVHCKSGSDRAGLVSALYLYGLEGKPADAADRELTVFCGHVPYLFWRGTIAMDHSFWNYASNHVQQSSSNGAASLAHAP
jgi:protein tyrosine phosphatase (PTP) superfamily phosphohydrolase (DUF442 family)